MAASGRSPPPKPWERAPSNSGPSPFAPSSATSTAETVATSSAAATNTPANKPAEQQSAAFRNVNDGAQGRVMPLRPWEQQGNLNRSYNTYGGYGYNSGYTGGYGGYSGYGGGMYGGGGGMYGSGYGGYGGGMYGSGGMYGNRFGYGGGYGMPSYGGYGNPMNPNNPDDPYGGPPRPPGFWQSMLRVMHGVMSFCGRLAILIDENTQAFHFFLTALLQLCDRAGSLYGELARFVLRLLGFRPRSSKGRSAASARALEGTEAKQGALVPSAGASSEGAWDNVWSNNGDAK